MKTSKADTFGLQGKDHKGWRWSSAGAVFAWYVQSPRFNSQHCKKNLIWCHMLLKIKDDKFNRILCYKMSLRPVWKTGGRKRGND